VLTSGGYVKAFFPHSCFSPAEPPQPVLETHRAEPRVVTRCKRPIVQFCAEIAGVDVGDDLAAVLRRRQVTIFMTLLDLVATNGLAAMRMRPCGLRGLARVLNCD
jgi:hypothetical protein